MPLYEYKCRECGHRFEVLSRSGSTETRICPKCKAGNTEKLFSSFAVGNSSSPAAAPQAGCAGCSPGRCPFARGEH